METSCCDEKMWRVKKFYCYGKNGKTYRRNRQHLRQTADRDITDDTILISDGEEENIEETEVNIKHEEVEMYPSDEVNGPHPGNILCEVKKWWKEHWNIEHYYWKRNWT